MFGATKIALSSLEESLQCSACHKLLMEPCTLGSCVHLICKACAGKYAGNACPACQAPAWAKDLQVKRELGMVVRLYRRLSRLVNSEADTGSGDATAASDIDDDLSDGIGDSALQERGAEAFVEQASRLQGVPLSGSETEAMSLSGSDKEALEAEGTSHKPCQRLLGSDTDTLSDIADAMEEDQQPTAKLRNTSHKKRGERTGAKGKSQAVRKKQGLKSSQLSQTAVVKDPSQRQGSGRKRLYTMKGATALRSNQAAEGNETGPTYNPLTIYDFEASPPRPKTRKMKKDQEKLTKREVQLKKLAAANKKWGAVSSVRVLHNNAGGKHVSFSDSAQKSQASRARSKIDPTNTGGVNPSPCLETSSKTHREVIPVELNKRQRQKAKNSPELSAGTAACNSKKEASKVKSATGGKCGKATSTQARKDAAKDAGGRSSSPPASSPTMTGLRGRTKARTQSNSAGVSTSKKTKGTPTQEDAAPSLSPVCTPEQSKTRGKRWTSGSGGVSRGVSGGVSASPNSSLSSPSSVAVKRNKRGETPLHLACIKGDIGEVQALLDQGADPNCKDNAGWTPLHEACNHGHSALLSLLLDNNALINAPGFEHDTPLHDAVNNNRLQVARFLRQRGASLQARNIHGKTPLDLPASAEMKQALLTEPLSATPSSPLPLTPATSPSQHLQDRQAILIGTGLDAEDKSKLLACARVLGGKVVESLTPKVTHLVAACEGAEGRLCLRTMKYLQAVLAGRWVVTPQWLEACLEREGRVGELEYEIQGTTGVPTSQAPRKGRENTQKQFPGLFDGCHFYFSGSFKHPTPSKTELTQLIKKGGGAILNRQPKPGDDVIQESTVVPYHAPPDSELALCAHYVVYDHLGERAPPRVRSPKVCTVPVYWLLDCVSQFTILDPPKD